MQVVFVHGVSTRSGSAHDVEVQNRERLLREVAFKGCEVTIRSPNWGDQVPRRAWDGACFPRVGRDQTASFGLLGEPARAIGSAIIGRTLADEARRAPEVVVDTLFAAYVDAADEQERPLSPTEVVEFAAAAERFASGGFGAGLASCADDLQLVDEVRARLELPSSFGVTDKLVEAAAGVADRMRNLASDGLVRLFRDSLNPVAAQFLGDVFSYLKAGEVRDRVRALLTEVLVSAHEARRPGEALVLIGHSLGGVILYDLLSSARAGGLPPDVGVDLLLTVGSQPGLFEELKLFDASDPAIPGAVPRVRGPDGVARWVNVYDPADLFGFKAQPIFEKAEDFEFDSITGLLDAHTTYLKRPQFHACLRERVDAMGLR